jgi:hypothetical protein
MNVLIIFISMGVIAHSEPNYSAAQGAAAGAAISGPGGPLVAKKTQLLGNIQRSCILVACLIQTTLLARSTASCRGVYAYGGAMLFNEFMSEMRRPRDFLKALAAAQSFHLCLLYDLRPCSSITTRASTRNTIAYQGIAPYAWQTVCNNPGCH